MKNTLLSLLAILGLFSACDDPESQNATSDITNPTNKVVLSSEIEWEQLNPARGDQSPQAGTVWGDRKGPPATGFLAKFVDGFSSPPHIHNVTYRAVVIKGQVHNDDPEAAEMWMGPGSLWTQPAGEAHITSAKGAENIAYVEIDSGPDEAFDKGERPVNIDASNIVWLGADKSNWIGPASKAEMSFLWESAEGLRGLFVKLPADLDAILESDGEILHAIVVSGDLDYTMPQDQTVKSLDPGSYFSSSGKALHKILPTGETVLYLRTNGSIRIK